MNRFWNIRARFMIFGILSLVPLVGFNWLLVANHNLTRQEDLLTSETVLSSQIATSVSGLLSLSFRGLESVASNPIIVEQSNSEEIATTLGQARSARPEFTGVFLVDAEGNLIGQAGTVDESILPAVSSQIESVLGSGQRTISGRIDLPLDPPTSVFVLLVPVTSTTTTDASATGNPTPIAPPNGQVGSDPGDPVTPTPEVRAPGTVRGVIAAIVPTDVLAQSVMPAQRGRTEAVVLSGEQIIVATGDIRDYEAEWVANLRAQDASFTGEGVDQISYTSLSGSDRSAVNTPLALDSVNWSVLVTAPVPDSQITSLWEQMVALLLVAAFVYLVMSYVFGELISRSLTDLTDSARRLADGDYKTPIAKRGSGEMAELRNSLIDLRHRTEEVMEASEERQAERQQQNEQLRDLLRRDLRMQEDERRHIASEIHDAVSPLITGALYQSRALQRANGGATADQVKESLTDVNDLLERASQELHGIIFDLRPPDLDDLGVVAAIEAFVSTIQRTGLEARLEVIDEPPPLTPEVRLAIYRIVQEALHNVLRHAGADEAVVRMEYVNQLLRVTIRDNGAGFDPEGARRPTSLGLLSMRERAASIDADFEILSRPGGGTVIIVERRDTGSIMSDELLETILKGRASQDVEESDDSAHNSDTDDAGDASAKR